MLDPGWPGSQNGADLTHKFSLAASPTAFFEAEVGTDVAAALG
jgi:hypothetical protein